MRRLRRPVPRKRHRRPLQPLSAPPTPSAAATAKIIRGDHPQTESDRLLVYGIETVPPIIGRAVLLDVAGFRHVDRLADGEEIGIDEVEAVLSAKGLTIRTR